MQLSQLKPSVLPTFSRATPAATPQEPASTEDDQFEWSGARMLGSAVGGVVGLGAGAVKWGLIGGGAVGGLGFLASIITGVPALRHWGFLAGAALGGSVGAVLGAQTGWDKGGQLAHQWFG